LQLFKLFYASHLQPEQKTNKSLIAGDWTITKLNCWEFKKCGREPGGVNCKEKGICSAATEASGNGTNGGEKSGRICWVVAGSFCRGNIQCEYVQSSMSCMSCDFFKLVKEEEGYNNFNLLKSGKKNDGSTKNTNL
jgi:hypothetical protein